MERCRICFTIHTSLEVLGEVPEKDFLESLFIKEQVNEQLSCFLVCYQCKALLKKSCKFIQKALDAQRAFLVLQNQSANTDVWVSFVNELGLNSTLSYHKVEINLFLNEENLLHEDEIDSKELLKDLVKVEIEPIPSDIDEPGDFNVNDNDNVNEIHKKVKPKHIKQEINSEDEEYKPYKIYKKHKQNKQNQKGKQNRTVHTVKERKSTPKRYEKSNVTELVPDNILTEKRIDAKTKKYSEPKDEIEEKAFKFKYIGYKNESESDDDFTLNNELISSESESSDDSYDDNGKKLKKPPRKYPRQCDHCDSEIQTGKSHYRHYLDHHSHDMYPYQMKRKVCICMKCGYQAKNKYVLKQHVATHGEKTILCPDCGKSYYNAVALGKHRYNFHRGRRFVCDYCKKAFQTASILKLHVRIHTGEKPYKCDFCDSRFATRGNLNCHMRSIHERVDKDGRPVAKQNRKQKNKSTEESKQEDTHVGDDNINIRKNKSKKTKKQAKDNEDENPETNNDDTLMKEINNKGKRRVTFQIESNDVVSSNNSKKQETDDDDDDDDVPLKTMKQDNVNLIELKNVQTKDFDNDINNLESTMPQTMDQTTMDYITQELF